MNEDLKKELISRSLEQLENPFQNITVKDVAKDLKMNENTTNETIFKRKDFPSVNLGKTKTITLIAYLLWKMERRENDSIRGDLIEKN